MDQESARLSLDLEALLPFARHLIKGPSVRRSLPAGYGIRAGEKVLVAVDSWQDPLLVQAIVQAIREEGATADLVTMDMGPDRELDEHDEIRTFMGNTPWGKEPIEPPTWRTDIEALTEKMGYNLLIRGLGGPTPKTNFRYEGIPWISREIFASQAVTFPYDLWGLLQKKSWDTIWKNARGGRVRVTDPEGTDYSFTFLEEHFDKPRYGFTSEPFWGHLHGHPLPPYSGGEDAAGVVAGTLNHWGRPFSHIKVHVEKGQVQRVEGGGKYGEAWRQLLEATKNITYPDYPRSGLFWLWETAIGTNPKFFRPYNVLNRSRGTVYERLRSGIIHVGFGTRILSPSEDWAREKGVSFGHIHVHLNFATYELTTKSGQKFKIIDRGHLTSLDDPEVIALAKKFGDPKELLKEAWIPQVPGISSEGDYWKDYAPNPAAWIKAHEAR